MRCLMKARISAGASAANSRRRRSHPRSMASSPRRGNHMTTCFCRRRPSSNPAGVGFKMSDFSFLSFIFSGLGSGGARSTQATPPASSQVVGGAAEELLSSSLGLSAKSPHPIIISIYRKSFIKRSLQAEPWETRGYLRTGRRRRRRRYQAGLGPLRGDRKVTTS